MVEATDVGIHERLEERIRTVLLKKGEPVKRYRLMKSVSDPRWTSTDYHDVLSGMEARGVVRVASDLMVELLDCRQPITFPSMRVGRPRKNPVQIRENPPDRGAWARRAATWDRTGGKCWYCGRQTNPFRDFQVDHLIPVSAGGSDETDNLVPCCTGCNFAKGPRTLDQFRTLYPTGHRFFFEAQE